MLARNVVNPLRGNHSRRRRGRRPHPRYRIPRRNARARLPLPSRNLRHVPGWTRCVTEGAPGTHAAFRPPLDDEPLHAGASTRPRDRNPETPLSRQPRHHSGARKRCSEDDRDRWRMYRGCTWGCTCWG
jgi:hypothetical protein